VLMKLVGQQWEEEGWQLLFRSLCVEMVVKTKENGCCCDVDPHVRISRGKVLTRCAKWEDEIPTQQEIT